MLIVFAIGLVLVAAYYVDFRTHGRIRSDIVAVVGFLLLIALAIFTVVIVDSFHCNTHAC